MTEAEWLASDDTVTLLRCVLPTASRRKEALYLCGGCRQISHLFVSPASIRAVEVAERFVDGLASSKEVADAAYDAEEPTLCPISQGSSQHLAAKLAESCVLIIDWERWHFASLHRIDWPGRWPIDCVFGNPFRPVTLDPGWQTEPVVGLAQAIYAEKTFDRLPILADALEDAGCDAADVLAHCRGPGPHVRGCWVVDLILGKS